MSVEFTDNAMKVKEEMASAVRSFLYEAGGSLQRQIIRNSRTDTGQTKGSYSYVVQESADESVVCVGSNLENAIWEEFGTGEYALNGDGRKTPWVYRDAKGNFHRTTGKTPNRPMYNAFNSLRDKLENRLQEILKQM